MRTLTMAALALALAVPAASAQQTGTQAERDAQRRELQQKMRELQQQMRELEREMARLEPETRATVRALGRVPMVQVFGSRARLGVNVATAKNAATDSIGAVLSGVTPSGPADQAGLKAGDIITSFNGEKLAGRYPAAGESESEPARKLVDFAQELEQGDTVRVDYRRGKEVLRATIVAKQLGSEGFSYTFTTPGVRIQADSMIATLEGARGALARLPMITWSSGWLDLELVALNPELGEYFGTTDGLLVIRAPEDSELQLKGGDVIISVDGRPATSQAQLMRILRSYESGEGVKLDIMRQKRRTTLTVKIPERRARQDRYDHQWDWNRP
ncbi:MAG: PDZ domain-containing protein [Gemmatimonadetes bacterium]|nr:PDZ domain-containing protein [Gemmatimonadota bacterium]